MRFRYLRIALLTGVLAATAPADSTGTKSKSATLHEERSPPTDRDDIAAIGPSGDDEDRTGSISAQEMSIRTFIEKVLLNEYRYQNAGVGGWSEIFNKLVKENAIPHEAYESLVSNAKETTVMGSTQWRLWAFFASKYCARIGKNPHEYIFEKMTNLYGAARFSEILDAAADQSTMKNLVRKLQQMQLSSWLENQYTLQTVFNLLQLEAVWDKNIFDSPRFATWTWYLKRLPMMEYEKNPVATEVFGLYTFIDYDSLLKMPMLPMNALHPKSKPYLHVLKLIGLATEKSPYNIVSALLKGVEESDEQFTVLFMLEPEKKFWMIYVKEFNEHYPTHQVSLCDTLASTFGMPKLMTMLHAAVVGPDEKKSNMALIVLEYQFSEWKKAGVTDIEKMMQDLTDIPDEDKTAIKAIGQAYLVYYYIPGIRLSKANFIM